MSGSGFGLSALPVENASILDGRPFGSEVLGERSGATFFSELGPRSAAALEKLAVAVRTTKPIDRKVWHVDPAVLVSAEVRSEFEQIIEAWAGVKSVCLYAIFPRGEYDGTTAVAAFVAAKKRDKGIRSYARAGLPSTCLYVGSSRSLSARVQQHLGFGHSGTYALQFAHWSQGLGIELDFCCAKYPSDTQSDVLQALEDSLWAELAPMFGRRGSR